MNDSKKLDHNSVREATIKFLIERLLERVA